MKTKLFGMCVIIAGILLLSSCGGMLLPTDYGKMPSGEDFEKVYNKLIDIMKESPEFYEVKGTFNIESKNMTPPTDFQVTYIPKDNKKTFYEYNFNMVDAHWTGPTQVTLQDRQKNTVERDEFSEILFTIEDMPPFSMFDEMYKKAIEIAQLGVESQVVAFDMNKFDGKNNFYITVAVKGTQFEKAVFFDKTGNVLKIEE